MTGSPGGVELFSALPRSVGRLKPGRFLSAALFSALTLVPAAFAQPVLDRRPPFLGEKLTFAMSVLGTEGGELTLSAKETTLAGRPAWKFELSAISGEFLSKLFLVRDYLASWVDPETFRTLRFEKHTVEGKRVRDDLIEFDYEKKIAYRDGKPIPIEENTLDTLSSLYLHPADRSRPREARGALGRFAPALPAVRSRRGPRDREDAGGHIPDDPRRAEEPERGPDREGKEPHPLAHRRREKDAGSAEIEAEDRNSARQASCCREAVAVLLFDTGRPKP